ncbi:MAG: 2Fe-2S iron-sulfur cluster-binding protein [Candidatus Diapherotrites archaeon]
MPPKNATTRSKKNKQKKKNALSQEERNTPHSQKKVVLPVSPLHVRIYRFNPHLDFSPRTHEYKLVEKEGESILDLLTRIKHTQDGSLTYRGNCGNGKCGACGIKVNGKEVLGCLTKVKDVIDTHNGLRIDPLHEKVLKDLAVDETSFFNELMSVKPWMVLRPNDAKRKNRIGKKEVDALDKTAFCNLCGICTAATGTSFNGKLGPASIVKAYRYIHDSRDGDVERINQLTEAFPVSYSISLADTCPRDIHPGKKTQLLEKETKRMMERKKLSP